MANDATKKPSTDQATKRWHFGPNDLLAAAGGRSLRGIIYRILSNVDHRGPRPVVPLGHGDPSVFPSFRITTSAEDAIVDSLRSAEHNHYPPTVGLLSARRAIVEHLSEKLPYELSPDDVFITAGCNQAIELVAASVARPGANILLPRPGYPMYETHCVYSNLEFRHFDLIPQRGWEIDLNQVVQLCDDNTVAIVVINPGNPCGSVLSYEHMEKVGFLWGHFFCLFLCLYICCFVYLFVCLFVCRLYIILVPVFLQIAISQLLKQKLIKQENTTKLPLELLQDKKPHFRQLMLENCILLKQFTTDAFCLSFTFSISKYVSLHFNINVKNASI